MIAKLWTILCTPIRWPRGLWRSEVCTSKYSFAKTACWAHWANNLSIGSKWESRQIFPWTYHEPFLAHSWHLQPQESLRWYGKHRINTCSGQILVNMLYLPQSKTMVVNKLFRKKYLLCSFGWGKATVTERAILDVWSVKAFHQGF